IHQSHAVVMTNPTSIGELLPNPLSLLLHFRQILVQPFVEFDCQITAKNGSSESVEMHTASERLGNFFRCKHGAHRKSHGHALRKRHNVWPFDARKPLVRGIIPGAPAASLNVIKNQEEAVLFAKLLQTIPKLAWIRFDDVISENRSHDYGCRFLQKCIGPTITRNRISIKINDF